MDYKELVVANVCDEDVNVCACEGTGMVPMNNDEDVPCPFHGDSPEDEKSLDRLTEDGFVSLDDEREALEMLNGGDDRDFIEGYTHDYLDSILYS